MGSGASLRCSVRVRASVSLLLLTAPQTRWNDEKPAPPRAQLAARNKEQLSYNFVCVN
jgi:hypothetical protein